VPLEPGVEIAIFLETTATLEQALRRLLVLPEVGLSDLRLDLLQLLLEFRCLKDSSAGRRPSSRGPGIVE